MSRLQPLLLVQDPYQAEESEEADEEWEELAGVRYAGTGEYAGDVVEVEGQLDAEDGEEEPGEV
jgi:hypothetical protein